MKILHTSDWHLGIMLNGRSMLDEQKHFIDRICDIVADEKIGAVVIAGDIYDTGVSNSEAISLFSYALNRLCNELGASVLVVAGNHDGAVRLSAYSDLVEKSGVYIKGRISRDIVPVEIDDVCFYLMPYFNTDEARAVFPEEDIASYTDAFASVCKSAEKNMPSGKTHIAVTHSFITGAQTGDSDRAAIVGSAANVAASVFEKFDYVCAGHIHKCQNIGKNCRYSGTPMRMSFSEANQEKGVTVYDTQSREIKQITIEPLFDMSIISGSLEEIISSAKYSEDYIKLELTSGFAGLEQQQLLREFYPNLIMITTKNTLGENEEISLRADDLQSLSPRELVESYFEEICNSQPEERQLKMLLDALGTIEEGKA